MRTPTNDRPMAELVGLLRRDTALGVPVMQRHKHPARLSEFSCAALEPTLQFGAAWKREVNDFRQAQCHLMAGPSRASGRRRPTDVRSSWGRRCRSFKDRECGRMEAKWVL